MSSVSSRTEQYEETVVNILCKEPCGLAIFAREEQRRWRIFCVFFVLLLSMNRYKVVTALLWLKENGVSAPNGTLGIYGMVLKPRS